MTKFDVIKIANEYNAHATNNFISDQIAISPEIAGMQIYDSPIFGFAKSDDELFETMKNASVIGEHFLTPRQWLPEAKTVISFFLPFTDIVKKSNSIDPTFPSAQWLHGRIEGQKFLLELCFHLQEQLTRAGYPSIIPSADKRFAVLSYSSNWSERHAAFICGLGTFGLSKNLITKKGVAGRFGSIITNLDLEPDSREYNDIYENCSNCGKCIAQCPVNAISLEQGKNHSICSPFLDEMFEKYKPRYGCGKCQVNVPCESCIPISTT